MTTDTRDRLPVEEGPAPATPKAERKHVRIARKALRLFEDKAIRPEETKQPCPSAAPSA